MAYDNDNIFAKILRGEIPCHKIYEDDQTLGFLDVMPQGKGHALVIPKTASETMLTADVGTLGALMNGVQIVAKAAMDAFDADGVMVMQLNKEAAGQTVFHTHFHVVPRFEGIELNPHNNSMADGDELAAIAKRYVEVILGA